MPLASSSLQQGRAHVRDDRGGSSQAWQAGTGALRCSQQTSALAQDGQSCTAQHRTSVHGQPRVHTCRHAPPRARCCRCALPAPAAGTHGSCEGGAGAGGTWSESVAARFGGRGRWHMVRERCRKIWGQGQVAWFAPDAQNSRKHDKQPPALSDTQPMSPLRPHRGLSAMTSATMSCTRGAMSSLGRPRWLVQ